MKTFLTILSLSFAGMALANEGKYTFISVPHSEVDKYLVPGSDATGTPAALQGLWWLDGNPVADEVISFANAKFTDIVVDGKVVGHETLLPIYDEGTWSWHDDDKGHFTYSLARKLRVNYHLIFNADYTHGDITPVFKKTLLPLVPKLEIQQNPLLKFTMDLVSADEYSRDSATLGKDSNYRFRRVVDGNGQRLANFDEFVAAMEAEGLATAYLPVCTLDNPEGLLPTPCAAN